MSGLAAKLAESRKPKPGPKCGFGTLLGELDDVDRQALINAVKSTLPGEQIADVLRSEGYQISGFTIQRHRNRRCSCERDS